MSGPVFTNHLEDLRQRVMDRMASLLESQTRSRAFASNLGALVREVQGEVMAELEALSQEAMPQNLALRLRRVIDTYRSLEQTMALLLGERHRQWSRNAEHAKTTLLEFNQTVTDLASTLIEKDLFERQSRVLERIILSHEHVAQWKAFVQEILADFPDGLDVLITGVGTGGHITGTAQVLKAKFPQLKVFAVEPTASPVISGGAPAPHPIQGIGAGFIPKNLDTSLLDGVIQVEAEAAREYARRSAREEGILVGISSGATLAAIAQKLPELPAGAKVLGFNYDTGERYLSVDGFLPS